MVDKLVVKDCHVGPIELPQGAAFSQQVADRVFQETQVRISYRYRKQWEHGKTGLRPPIRQDGGGDGMCREIRHGPRDDRGGAVFQGSPQPREGIGAPETEKSLKGWKQLANNPKICLETEVMAGQARKGAGLQ